jgi:RHS repeat-associated protein
VDKESDMWTTNIQNNLTIAISANGSTIQPGGSASIPCASTGVEVRIPGAGRIQALAAGIENPYTDRMAVKLVSGDWFGYWGGKDQATMSMTVFTAQGKTLFLVTGGPPQVEVQRSSPDNVFPVPSLSGDVVHDGVNLFTGDVNQTCPLATITDGQLSLSVAAFYNSRSVGLGVGAKDNVLGGNGWKLLDYPKIVQEGGTHYFLDGNACYPLDRNATGNGYVVGGSYHAWKFIDSPNRTSWSVTDDHGIVYALANKSTLATGRTVWNLSSVRDPCWAQSVLTVEYKGNAISSVTNSLGDRIDFYYSNEGRLLATGSSVVVAGTKTLNRQVVLAYDGEPKTPGVLTTIQAQARLASGGSTPADAGVLFSYFPANDPIYPLAMRSVRSPLGAVMSYTYYGGGIPASDIGLSGQHPVITVTSQSQPNDKMVKGLFYSFWSRALDPTQTYLQFNLAKEYPGGVYTSVSDDAPGDPYGHTSYLFFTGQPSTALISYTGVASVATDPCVSGKVYWTGNFEILRTLTLSPVQPAGPVGAWPGVLIPVSIPAGGLVCSVSCLAHNKGPLPTDIALDLENAGQQLHGVHTTLDADTVQTVTFDMHSLAPTTHIRAWIGSTTPVTISGLTVTYVVPPSPASVPAIANVQHRQQIVVTGTCNPLPLNPGASFAFTTPCDNATGLTVNFWNLDGASSSLTATCLDASGKTVGTGSFLVSNYRSETGTVTFAAPSQVARVILTATSASGGLSNVAVTSAFLTWRMPGEPVTDDALTWMLSATASSYQIVQPGPHSFARLTSSVSSVDGVMESTTYGYTDSVPYVTSIGQSVVKPDQAGVAGPSIAMSRRITYAMQHYPALEPLNILDEVAEVLDSAGANADALTPVSGSATQWKQWGTSWAIWRQTQRRSANATSPFASPPSPDWRQIEIVNQRNARGNVVSGTSADGVVSTTIYDAIHGHWPVAMFVNADVAIGQAGWIGFEAYESTSAWTMTNGAVVTNQAFTGFASYKGTNATVVAKTLVPAPTEACVVAAWVRLDVGAHCMIGAYNGDGRDFETRFDYDPKNPDWVYVETILPQSTMPYAPAVKVTSGSIDHVVFAPLNAGFTASVWDMPRRALMATVIPHGGIHRAFHDSRGAILATATPGKGLSLIDQTFWSVLGQLWFSGTPAYNPSMPNQALAVRTPADGLWDDFTSQTGPMFTPAELTNLSLTGNHLLSATAKVMATTPGTAAARQRPTSPDFVVCAEIIVGQSAGGNGQSIGLTVRNNRTASDLFLSLGNLAVTLTDLRSGTVLQTSSLQRIPPTLVLTLVVRDGTRLYAYADGNFLFAQTLGVPVSGPVGLRTTWPGSAFYNFGLVSNPELCNSAHDGHGAETQFLASSDAFRASVTQSLYGGELMLYSGKTLPTTRAGATLAPVPDFAAFDSSTMTVSGSITNHWPDTYNTSPFADSQTSYTDPILRTKSRGKGGIYTAGKAGAVSYSYGEDNDGYFNFPKDQLNTNITTGPTGAMIVTYSNRQGIMFGKARIDPDSGASLLTGYEFDNAMRKTAIYYPSAYADPTTVDTSTFYRTFSYDFVGNLSTANDSDSGTVQFAYDSAGRQRLAQDAAGLAAQPPYCVYTKYDSRGRVIETGTRTGALTQVTQAELDTPTWPADLNRHPPHRFFKWDTPTLTIESNSIGRMTEARAGDLYQQFAWNAQGQPTFVFTNSEFLIGQLSLACDGLGRLTAMTDAQSGYDVAYRYDEQGRMVAVGTAADPTAWASYTYGNGTVTETLLKGVATRVYTTNALGDIQSIVDEYFSEQLYFETRHNGQPGYLNGQVASAACAFSWSGAPAGYVYEYTYDNFGRLTRSVNSGDPAWSIGNSQPTTYDNNGNILTINRGDAEVAFTYQEGCNRLLSSGTTTFGYDANGNVTSSTSPLITDIKYSPLDRRPEKVTFKRSATGGKSTVNFTYDAQGWRVMRKTPGETITYLRDPLGRVLCERDDTGSAFKKVYYIYGLRGRIAMVPADSATTYVLLTDHNQSTRVVVDNNRKAVAWFNYDPYGQILESNSNRGTIGLRYLYCGQELDNDLKLYEFAARFYDPTICRFYMVDPRYQFSSPYIYSNNPVSFSDPTGEWFVFDDLIATVGGALIGGGLELAREAIAGESLSWKKIALGAAVGAAVGETALYTAGGSIFAAGAFQAGATFATSGALTAAAGAVGSSMAAGAVISGAWGGLDAAVNSGNTGTARMADIGWGILGGAVSGAQIGMVMAVVAPAAVADYLDLPIDRLLLDPRAREWTRTFTSVAVASWLVTNKVVDMIMHGNRNPHVFRP